MAVIAVLTNLPDSDSAFNLAREVVRLRLAACANVLSPAPALVLAAAGLQDPGNAGAIIRSAAAAGATGVVLDDVSADPWG